MALRIATGGVLACIAMLATAQNPQRQQGAAASTVMAGPYRIAGILVNAKTDEPVRRATVEALEEADSHAVASCVTDNDGHFVLPGLAAAKYQLTASKRGFRTAFYDEHDEFSTAIVTGPDQDTTHLRFKLMPRAVLHGTVTGDDGEPAANARVMLFQRHRHSRAGERATQADATMTDDTGAFEFGDLAAGEYLLAVMAEPWYAVHEGSPAKRNPALDVAYPVTYFDSTTEEGSATPIVLAGGSREEANISLHAVPALHLRVESSVRPDGGGTPANLQQTVFGVPVGLDGEGISGDGLHGVMEVAGIAPGHYELTQGDPSRIVELDLASSQQVDPNAGSAAIKVTGGLRMASGAPVTGEPTITLARMDGGSGQPVYATQAHKGRFTFDAVPAGQWAVMATGDGTSIPVVGVSGGGGVQRAGNVVTLRDRGADLVVTLSDAQTRVEGFAQKNGKGFAGAMIVLLPRNPAQWEALTRRDQSDSDGSFALQNVAPGEYTVVAIEDGWEIDWTNPLAMARYLPAGTSVTVSEKSGALIHLASPVTVETH